MSLLTAISGGLRLFLELLDMCAGAEGTSEAVPVPGRPGAQASGAQCILGNSCPNH